MAVEVGKKDWPLYLKDLKGQHVLPHNTYPFISTDGQGIAHIEEEIAVGGDSHR